MVRQTTTPLPQLIYPRVINLRRRLQDLIYTPISAEVKNAQTNLESKSNDTSTANVAIFVGPVHKEYIPWEDAITETLEPIHVGDSFSPASFVSSQDGSEGVKEFPWTQRWFRIDVHILESGEQTQRLDQEQQQHQQQHDQCEYCLYFLAHGEFTIYTSEGRVWCGIDPCHSHIPLSSLLQQQTQDQKCGRRQISCTLWLDGGQYQTGFWFGLQPPTEELGFRLLKVQLQRKNNLAYATYHDLSMLIEWVEYMYEREGIPLNTENGYYQPLISVSPCLRRVLYLLNQSCDGYDQTKTLASLQVELQSIYQQFTTSSRDMKICHVGHAHMDLVWLWPERVTYQKIVHTYSNVLQLMNKYPQFTFTMSQPPLYYHILEKQPELAARISERIENGQWEFTGALEVEADTQIPVGEGLVRCILYGQERIKAIRGSASRTVWIPDVFGYSQCLPQIFALAEIPNFFTTKILWSTITKFPHNSFVWKGPDGESEVIAHLSVAGYNGKVTLKEAMTATRKYHQADVHDEVLCPSGYGDGGGGPSEDQVERSLRLQRSFVGETTPSCRWDTVDSFFQRLAAVKDNLPIYRGELFLEFHRAVHTTQSDFKYNLRSCERALQTREAMRVISGNCTPLSAKENWERYLFALFHDATPGSSINSVYKELNAELKSLAKRQYQSALGEWPRQPAESKTSITIVNPLAWERHSVVELHTDFLLKDHGDHYLYFAEEEIYYPIQVVDDTAYVCVRLKGLSAIPFQITNGVKRPKFTSPSNMTATPNSLGNGIVHAEFNSHGQINFLSIHGSPILIAKGDAASFTLHQDQPEAYDAWDMDHHIVWMKESIIREPITLRVVACGPVVSILQSQPITIGENGSNMIIEYRLNANQDSLSVKCKVDWKESHKTLRYQIPTLYCGDVSRFGAPFNFVDRSQIPQGHKEEAQWEVPGSRWASVLNGSMTDGLSIVTQAKYGFRAKQGTLGLTLLRSPTQPDPMADKGVHNIQFAITRHHNTFSSSDLTKHLPTAAKADDIFTPLVILSEPSCRSIINPPIKFNCLGSAVPSWVLPSNKSLGFCIRLHENAGDFTKISFSIPQKSCVQTVNFNEKVLSLLEPTSSDDDCYCYDLFIPAYKIVTLQILI